MLTSREVVVAGTAAFLHVTESPGRRDSKNVGVSGLEGAGGTLDSVLVEA